MYEFKIDKTRLKSIFLCAVIACFVSLLLGLLCRPIVAHAQEGQTLLPATQTDVILIATSSDVDASGYLTNDTMSQTDILLSIRNILVCIWGSLVIGWAYSRMKAIIYRLSGKGGKH